MTSQGARAPSGRAELLYWINTCCGMHYPSVEALRDGAAYCLVVESSLQRAAAQSKKSGAPSTTILEQRANLATKLLQRVDWDARNLTTVQSAAKDAADPSLDSIQLRDACERNFQVLQDVLRRCVPKDHTLEIDSKRLAMGKLQEHVRLLQWLYSFSVKMAKAFPADAVKQEAAPPVQAGPRPRSRSAGGVGAASDPGRRQQRHADPAQALPLASSGEYSPQRYSPSASPSTSHAMGRAELQLVGTHQQQRPRSSVLASLVARVEAYEAEAAKATTEDSKETDADVTITDLKAMLEERDVLWQTLSMIEQIVEAERDRALRAGASMPMTPLLLETAAIFRIPLQGGLAGA